MLHLKDRQGVIKMTKFLQAIDTIVTGNIPDDEAELSVAIAYMEEIREKLKEIEDSVKERLDAGIDVPNVRMVQGKSRRVLKKEFEKDQDSFIEKIVNDYGVPKQALYKNPELKTVLQIMELVDEPEKPGFEAEFIDSKYSEPKMVYERIETKGDF